MVNISDVAKKAKVSTATVSRALSNPDIVSEQTRNIVLRAAKELNYIPSLIAASLRTNISGFVGFLIPNFDLPMFRRVIIGIDDYLNEVDYSLLITDVGSRIDRLENQLMKFIKRKIGGIIYCSVGLSDTEVKIVKGISNSNNIPIVFIDRILPELDFPYVINNNFLGAYKATEHLIECGHEKIALVFERPDISSIKSRLEGFKSAHKDKNIIVDNSLYFLTNDFSLHSGYKIAKKIFNKSNKFSAIFCLTDDLAIGVLKYAHENQIAIPDDFSLMGYDDIQFSAVTNPALTTVHQLKHKMGYEAAKLIIKEINRKIKPQKRIEPIKKIVLEPYLVKRDSVKKIK